MKIIIGNGAKDCAVSPNTFDARLEDRINAIRQMLANKAIEYAPNRTDRMHNFNTAASREGKSPIEILHGFNVKHLTSFYDMLRARANQNAVFDSAYIKEKLGDIINYFIIAEIMLLEESKDYETRNPPQQNTYSAK